MPALGEYPLALPPDTSRVVVAVAFGPIEALLIGAAAGFGLSRIARFNRYMSFLFLASFAFTSSALLWYFTLTHSGELSSYGPLADFGSLLGKDGLTAYFNGNQSLAAAAALIGVYDAGFIAASGIETVQLSSRTVSPEGARHGPAPPGGVPLKNGRGPAGISQEGRSAPVQAAVPDDSKVQLTPDLPMMTAGDTTMYPRAPNLDAKRSTGLMSCRRTSALSSFSS